MAADAQGSRSRRWRTLAAWPLGIVLFVLALFSTGAGHGSYWAVIAFYPLQFLVAASLEPTLNHLWPDTALVVVAAALSLPWYPLLVSLFTSRSEVRRRLAVLLVLLQLGAGAWVATRVW